MATGFEFFERDLKVATAGMDDEAINRAVAAFARQEVARVISAGIASPQYDRFVNGAQGVPEEAFRAPGAIVYEFLNWPLVINAAIEELQKRSPRKSGRFASSFIVIVNGRAVAADFSKISPDAEVIITNAQPYVRKAEVGKLGIPEQRLFKGTARVLAGRFTGVFTFESRFLDIRAGLHPLIPYRLKGRGGRDRVSRRSGAISYPSIIINSVA